MSATSPAAIDASISRITSASADGYALRVGRLPDGIEAGPDWLAVDELLTSESLKAAMLADVTGVDERPADHICAEWMIESWARAIADLAGSFIISDRRLPDLTAGNLIAAPFKGMVSATAVRSPRMTALDGDTAAFRAGTDAVGHWTGLADLMHEGMVSLFAPVITWADQRGLRPAKTLWHSCGDRVAQSLLWSGKAFQDEEFALDLTRYLMNLGGPLAVPVQRDEDDLGQPFHLRSTCCLVYRTPEGGYCQACPLIREVEPPT